MSQSLSSSYRPSRWPLIKIAGLCVGWALLGSVLLSLDIGFFRWLGFLPLSYGVARWMICIRPRWKHVVILDVETLKIGNQSYDWAQFDELRLDRHESKRTIRLIGGDGKLDILIKDDLPGFSELARECFFHMNRPIKTSTPQESSRLARIQNPKASDQDS